MTKKKRRKKPALEEQFQDAPGRIQEFRILAQVELTPEVEEILGSNEAKLYLKGIERANAKLQAMIQRELGKS